MTNAALFFHPDGYDTSGQRLMGRHSAGESFLRGFVRHAAIDQLVMYNAAGRPQAELQELLQRVEPTTRSIDWIERRQLTRLGQAGCLYMPTPNLGPEAWGRQPFDSRRYSLCGVTHTTATHRVMDIFQDLILSPLEPWDALICTSSAVRAAVETQFEAIHEHLERRLGASRRPQPQLATIPLGVNPDDFARDPQARADWRARLGATEDTIVVLYMGRLQAGAKMNPAVMALALEAAASRTGRPVAWIVAGWAGSEAETERFHAQTRAFCPSVAYHAIDGRPAETRFSIWSAADIFLSLSDNIQETFGLTPIEAMAAGLPSVVSDWDGYKDTVRDGIDGFRITTHAPRPGMGQDLAYQHAQGWVNYEQYLTAAAHMTAVDLRAATDALVALIEQPDLRRRMGEAAGRQAREVFGWSAIVPRYQALWGELAARRKAALGEPAQRFANTPNPRRLDPFTLFASYPTAPLTPDSVLMPAPGVTWALAAERLAQPMAALGRWAMATEAEVEAVFTLVVEAGVLSADAICATFPPPRRGVIERSLLRLAKFGILEIAPAKDA